VTRPRPRTLLGRAIRRRCPSCGGHPIFDGWLHMKDQCPSCGLVLNRKESGYSLGGFWLNLLFAEGVTAVIFVTTLVRTWPDPPWTLLQYGLPLLALLTPVLFYPFSKTLFLAIDLAVRPAAHEEHGQRP
jgi:uncharacterized protein (DUF983 family)